MLPSLRDVLDGPFAPANPLVLAGHSALRRPVRWVHSSEIYEISPLLSGGELLLTTGLGLSGVDAGTRRHYLREIAGRAVAGVAVELGRTFDAVPPDMVEEASRHSLPLIALRAVVPFIELCRAANTEIVSREVGSLRLLNALARDLTEELAAGNGLAQLLTRVGAATGCALIVTSGNGALIAAHGVDDDRSAWAAVESATATAVIRAKENTWGTLTAGPGSVLDDATLGAVLAQSAPSLGLALAHSGSPTGRPQLAASTLLADLLDGKTIRQADLKVRATAAGVPVLGGRALVPVAADAPDARIATRLIDTAAKELGRTALVAEVHATGYGVLALDPAVPDPVGEAARLLRNAFATNAVEGVTVVVGDPCEFTAAALTGSLEATRSALRLATRYRRDWLAGSPLSTCRELATELVVEALPVAERDRLIGTTIAPLIAWDTTHHSELTRTLEVYLRHGGSATRCAAALHIGRQSLYQRLERIRDLLGYDPAAPALAGTLLLALCAHRLRD
ncbi:PucR family transcriptional regulator [Nocardia brasiliensis]|uniref:PucR family transcriptional regulator n=1 Tax=Nocardia brasiliensis TaxID=37326 RepID=A0A6G9XW51_NOCBR|nr:PucR family transcriptional regulator [Nocardia brasiliensis]QIS05145.1 PucR family transcriptional regulator [Nocardia brasiliensis]